MAYTTIDKPTDYFNTVTWTGTSDATTSVTGVNFQPDFVWIKNRNVADDHTLHDVVRGSTKTLFSNATNSEGTNAESIKSFDTDGFTTGNHRGTGGDSGNGMVAWNWLAGGTASSNTDGDITSTVSVNQTSGFSIVKSNTGGQPSSTTVSIGHGLNAVPKFFIVKNLPSADNWYVYHNSLGNTKGIILSSTNGEFTNADIWGSTTPTSSVFSINTGEWGVSTQDKITYCFAEKKGFSKFGSYTGNGNADGTFVYTGFKPAWLMIKRTDSADAWFMFDNKRAGAYSPNTNPSWEFLLANASNTGANTDRIDLYSNGFKMRYAWDSINASGGSYIYMAFAENPFVTSTGIPTVAR